MHAAILAAHTLSSSSFVRSRGSFMVLLGLAMVLVGYLR
jgi:hypothetical protein